MDSPRYEPPEAPVSRPEPGGLWEKLDVAVVAANGQLAQEAVPSEPSRWSRWKWRIVNIAAAVLWVYAGCKVFVIDIDRYLVDRLWPQGGWIVTYRFFILLAIASFFALALRRLVFFAWIVYFALFPLIVIAWWIPLFIYKRQSWIVLLAVINGVTTLVQDFRYTLVSKSLALIAIAVIVVSPLKALSATAGAGLIVLLAIAYVRTLGTVLRPSRFVTSQQTAIDRIMGSSWLTQLWSLSDDLRDPRIVRFDSGQTTKFTTAVSWGVVFHRALYFWAFQLDTYRKGATPYVFNLLTYVWLFLQTVVAFAFANYALYAADPGAFTFTVQPQIFDFFHYTINVMLGSSVSSLEAHSRLALALGDAVRLSGPLVLITVFATFMLSLRQTRQDEQMKESIRRIKARGRQFEAEFQDHYEISIPEAIERLRRLPGALLGFIAWFSRRIPPDFEEA